MKLAVFSTGADLRAGVADLDQGVIRDVTGVLGDTDLAAVLGSWDTIRPALEGELASRPAVPLDSVQLHAPLRPVRNIFCVGKNYSDHVREFGRSGYDTPERSEAIPEAPVIFSKATTSVTGPFDDIDPHHGVTKELDYEAELGVIIGRGGRGITQEHAFEHVWGYTIIDDFTARDLQRQHKQWLLGKSLDTHCPLGPYAVSADEIADVTALVVESRVNGELRQSAPVADLIFDIPTLIETISAGITLLPGDIIATGTPAGVGIGFDPPRFMTSGDTIEISITGLGTQRNRIA
ncbi:MAG TPA: fumarylacetoacetate hydrolase family protein [Streptosporangiaceae bacterium]|jgi:2-keto-4-pentenoate hydratase/2-oxohepta-3-ene-1,7-dioic acid hydratase in catechol pathway